MESPGPGRGHFEAMELFEDRWRLSGWICHPDMASTSVAAKIDGLRGQQVAPSLRPDLAAYFPWMPHAGKSGFQIEVPRGPGRQRVEVEALHGERVLTRLRTTISGEFEDLAQPPARLMRRVSATDNVGFFNADGVRSYTEFFDAVAEYRGWDSVSRMLDWGCGCGRVTRCFLRAHPEVEVHGCDIDAEAVAWCAGNLTAGQFRAIAPEPPTDYPDGFFPLVIGYSVFSHLGPRLQRAWLAEMRRIMSPGGLFLASVHGPFAARFALPRPDAAAPRRFPWSRRKTPPDVRAAGFFDAGEDVALRGVAPSGYYRGAFQSPEWTRREWSELFRVRDIVEGGMQNYQDLVVLERK
jgi:SAM-dependent methyltransferase